MELIQPLHVIASLLRKTHRCALNVVRTLANDLEFIIIESMTCICQLAMKATRITKCSPRHA